MNFFKFCLMFWKLKVSSNCPYCGRWNVTKVRSMIRPMVTKCEKCNKPLQYTIRYTK